MKIIHSLNLDHSFPSPVVLTIGFFDGLHKGHQKIFKEIQKLKGDSGKALALTFKNHPSTITHPAHSTPLILPWQQKVGLLKKEQLDALFLLDFTEELREQSADDFIACFMEHCPIDHLLLGPNATIGKDRRGNSERLSLLGMKYGFSFHEVDYDRFQGQVISSTRIRELIQKGDLDHAETFLGRKYSLQLPVTSGKKIGTTLGFPTLNFDLENLVHPPLGVYEVQIKTKKDSYHAIANLGFAPTVKKLKAPLLEVHLLEPLPKDSIDSAEIIFLDFIRKERKFSSIDELKKQIQSDIDFILTKKD